MTKTSSYGLIKTIIDYQKELYQANQLDGKFQFEIENISDQGCEELKKNIRPIHAGSHCHHSSAQAEKNAGGR